MKSVGTGHSVRGDYEDNIGLTCLHSERQTMVVKMIPFVFVFISIISNTQGISNISSNVCYDQEATVTLVNTSYLATVTETVWELCFKIPPQCPRKIKHLVPRIKTENITRVSNIAKCCPGYEENVSECIPTCDPPCSFGICSAPYTCSCEKGYSGSQCQEKGCPGGRWGDGCIMNCFCKNGGKCHAVDGTCYCTKGFYGPLCENKCSNGTYGENCSRKCNCSSGYSCHHISGECVKCSNDTFGDKCEQACECNKNGTALCSHVDGRCFCEANWFGSNCHLNCPFGFVDGKCVPSLENETCTCPSDLFLCDPRLGCVCPPGQDCGIEQNHQDPISLGFTKADQSSVGVAVVIVLIFVIFIMIFCFVLIYYRRKLKELKKKDLAKRSGVVNHCVDNNEIITPIPSLRQYPVIENNQISIDRPTQDAAHNPLYNVNFNKPGKNVNVVKAVLERSPSNLNRPGNGNGDYELYQEPKELPNDLRAMLAKGAFNYDDNDDYDSYDHLDHKRTINDVSPNYFKFSK